MANGRSDALWIGADPGGKNAFGLAMLWASGKVQTFCVSCADEAVDLILARPCAAGVDAPLWWSSGLSSDRVADQWIRKTYGIASGTVQTANSLRGAALVQAAMFVSRLRGKFPGVPVTEAHPKAVAIALKAWPDLSHAGEHERDAHMAAIAAREGFEGRWPIDLSLNRHPSEQDPQNHWLGPIHYFWPQQ